MIYSMTGFGSAEYKDEEKMIRVEVKTLNSKFTDIKFRLSHNFKEKELQLRRFVQNFINRGKADISIDLSFTKEDDTYQLNEALVEKYFNIIKSLKNVNPELEGDVLQSIMRIPSVVVEREKELDDENYVLVKETLTAALNQLNEFRMEEGKIIYQEFKDRVKTIKDLLGQVAQFEDNRIDQLRDKFQKALDGFAQNISADKNRMEQEIIYYMEKLDISEEKSRLKQHCDYFTSFLDEETISKGKKLNFICQEMGREINTLGSKANSSDIQHLVVNMKDELEKIKEQIGNVV